MISRRIFLRSVLAAALLTAAVLSFGSPQSPTTSLLAAGRQQASASLSVPAELTGAIESIDKMVAADLARDAIGSVTVGVVVDGRLVWTRSYGTADMEKKLPATADSVYRIGSITKQFTALMLLQLVEQGKVRLSDPVSKYLPEVNQVQGRLANAPPITLVQLATMTSGLDREPANLDKYLVGPVAQWEKVLLSALPQTKYAYEPDTRYFYSNIGYAILGAALGRAAGQPYTEYVTQHIFAPLGMAHTSFESNPTIAPAIAKGYAVEVRRPATAPAGGPPAQPTRTIDAETPAREHQGRGYKVPNGAIYTTVGDLARFVAFELGAENAAVLKKATLEDNYSRVNSSDGTLRTGYGIGFMLARVGDVTIYGHGGSVAGYNAAAHFDRSSGTGVVILRNVSGGAVNVNSLAQRAMITLAGARKKPTS